MNATGTVYALVDPRSGLRRYVGSTEWPLATRLSSHISKAVSIPVRGWIETLGRSGLRPEIVPVEADVDANHLWGAEARQIREHWYAGWPLLNQLWVPQFGRIDVYVNRERLCRAHGDDALADEAAALLADLQAEIGRAEERRRDWTTAEVPA